MRFFLAIFLLFLTSCNLAPRYRPPCVNPQASWRIATNQDSTVANVRFWESFEDPVLNELILLALSNNKDLQVAAWRVCQFYGQYLEVRSQLYPQVDLESTALKEKFAAIALPPSIKTPITPFYEFQFTLSYEIDLWWQLRNATTAAWEELLAQVENRRTVVLTLCSSVAQSYIFLRQLDRELQIAYETLAVRREAVRIAIDRFEGGETSEIDVTQAISLFEQAEVVVVTLEQQIPVQENLISVLVGENPTTILRGKAVDEFMFPPLVPAGLPAELLIRRPDILEAENLLIASNAQIGVARAAFFPQVTLTGLFGGESLQLNHLFSGTARQWQIGGTLFQPIYTGGFLTGQLIAAIAENKEAFYHYQQVVLTAFKEVNDALISHAQAKKLAVVETNRVNDLKRYLELSWLRYYEGETEYLTVLNASQELFTAELDLAQAQGDIFITLVEVYKALGGGWVVDADCNLRNALK